MRDLAPPRELAPLPVPIPPMLEEAIGYTGAARWWAMYYASTQASWTDGQRSRGGSFHAYSMFLNHNVMKLFTRADMFARAQYDFGSDEGPPQHYLLVDRIERRIYVMDAAACEVFLRGQWTDPAAPPAGPLHLTADDLRLMRENFQLDRAAEVSPAAIASQMHRERCCAVAMKRWLDNQPKAKAAKVAVHRLTGTWRD